MQKGVSIIGFFDQGDRGAKINDAKIVGLKFQLEWGSLMFQRVEFDGN